MEELEIAGGPSEGKEEEEQKEANWSKRIAIGCGLLFFLTICACCALSVAFIAFISYYGGEPEGLDIQVDYPWSVRESENFELTISLKNRGTKRLLIEEILLDEAFATSILDGAVVEWTEPEMGRDYTVPGIKAFTINLPLDPGESQEVIFHLQAVAVGEFGGDVAVYVGEKASRRSLSLTVIP